MRLARDRCKKISYKLKTKKKLHGAMYEGWLAILPWQLMTPTFCFFVVFVIENFCCFFLLFFSNELNVVLC